MAIRNNGVLSGGVLPKETLAGGVRRTAAQPGGAVQRPRDGISPTIAVEDIEGGHRITITDVNGEHTVDILNGIQGDPGEKGDPGEGVPEGGTDGQVIVMGDGSADWKTPVIGPDAGSSADLAVTDEAVTDEPNYTPDGVVELQSSQTPAELDYSYDSAAGRLTINGVRPITVPTGATFRGTGVKFRLGFEEEET